MPPGCGAVSCYFNPRPLAGATTGTKPPCWNLPFQSTPPCGGDNIPTAGSCERRYFNPRPLAGATCRKQRAGICKSISIHAPLRGRPALVPFGLPPLQFQSTPPCGGDRGKPEPVRNGPYFNPRPLAGATKREFDKNLKAANFNPRPLAGATPTGGWKSRRHGNFNPRPLAGATHFQALLAGYAEISIHAPLRGRLPRRRVCRSQPISIHAPLRGRPDKFYVAHEDDAISIHAPLRGRHW